MNPNGPTRGEAEAPVPELSISLEKICFVIAKARELDVKVAPSEMDDASDEDAMQRILEDYADDPTLEELRRFLGALNDDELKDLLGLAWMGRGDFGPEGWGEAREEMEDPRAYRTGDYLIGTPLLADFLEEGLAMLGLDCRPFEEGL